MESENYTGSKEGHFEWITDFQSFKTYFSPSTTGLETPKTLQRVLVIGCGTSNLSKELLDDGYNLIVSIDNDEQCISHMSTKYLAEDINLKWMCYDIVEKSGRDENFFRSCDGFDVIVDKGTFDAILVEGSCFLMLAEVHRLLSVGGVYIVCSINSETLLRNLFTVDTLGYECQFFGQTRHDDGSTGNVVVCKKVSCSSVDQAKLAQEEKFIMDNFFQIQQPLLTQEMEKKIRQNFQMALLQSNSKDSPIDHLPNYIAHIAMFSTEDRLAYSIEMFTEDLQDFATEFPGFMSVQEAIRFITLKQ